jgi:hypothetical protein
MLTMHSATRANLRREMARRKNNSNDKTEAPQDLRLRFQRKLQSSPLLTGLEPTLALDCSLSGTDGKAMAPVKRAMRRGHS